MNAIEFSKSIRSVLSGSIIEIPSPVPTLPDGRPLGIVLDGSVVQLNLYPLIHKFIDNNNSECWYRCDSEGNKRSNGRFIKLPDVESNIDGCRFIVVS